NGGKNSLNRLIRCVCGKKIGPDPRNFNQRVSLGRNDLLIRTFPNWITIPEIKTNNVKGNSKAIMLAPFSQQIITLGGSVARQYKITLIDDYGNYISDSISVK
ncbi:fimbrial biogenesis chaperone, partial [Klebsiella quasipneumoniae]